MIGSILFFLASDFLISARIPTVQKRDAIFTGLFVKEVPDVKYSATHKKCGKDTNPFDVYLGAETLIEDAHPESVEKPKTIVTKQAITTVRALRSLGYGDSEGVSALREISIWLSRSFLGFQSISTFEWRRTVRFVSVTGSPVQRATTR